MHDASPMRPVLDLIPFDEARARILEALAPTKRSEPAPLAEAAHRVLVADVTAPIDVPGFDRSAMDGYAVRAQDTLGATDTNPRTLRLVGAIHAGGTDGQALSEGTCVQIATGAPLPRGADAVVMVEQTRRQANRVEIRGAARTRQHVTARGSDLRRGETALTAGTVLTPARLGALAALGLDHATVWVQPRVALLSTGSELREPGVPLGPGEIHDSNSASLAALLRDHGALVDRTGILPDDPTALESALDDYRDHDLILVTGSSSAGEHDYLIDVLHKRATIKFHGVHVRPGKPLLLATLGDTPLIGLAGNPASCLMMTYALVVPAVRNFQHRPVDWARRRRLPLVADVSSPAGKRHFLPVRIHQDRAESAYKESDQITSVSRADGYIEIPDDVTMLPAGTQVDVCLF